MSLRALVLMALLGVACGSGAQAQVLKQTQPPSAAAQVLQVKFVCGTFDGSWSCKRVPGGIQHGKGALSGPIGEPDAARAAPETNWQGATGETGASGGTAAGQPMPAPGGAACPSGMVGTPPNCGCPQNSELLGGNCVRYTATTCSNGLAADALPQACRSVEEKLSCKVRADGLKDCCCVLYDKM
jgi:hypothetical protein